MRYSKQTALALMIGATLIFTAPVHAHDDGQHHEGGMPMPQHDHAIPMNGMAADGGAMASMDNAFLVTRQIDGYDVSFHVMEAQPGMMHGGSHNFMIKVEKDGKVVNDIVMNTKVIYPDGVAESKPAMKMGDWMMVGYDLRHSGRHQMMILFKTADGRKHKGGIYYPDNK